MMFYAAVLITRPSNLSSAMLIAWPTIFNTSVTIADESIPCPFWDWSRGALAFFTLYAVYVAAGAWYMLYTSSDVFPSRP